MTAPVSVLPHLEPDADAIATLAVGLRELGFDRGTAYERFEIPMGATLDDAARAAVRERELTGPLDVLVAAFVHEQDLPTASATAHLDPELLEALRTLGLATWDDETFRPQLAIGELDGIWFVTDQKATVAAYRDTAFEGGAQPLIMPYFQETIVFGSLLPRSEVPRGLDLGTGCGIHALLMARHAEAVIATDISERALGAAAFNAQLNRIDNVELRLGPVWTPVEGETFDVIVSNPPYQPDAHHASGENWWGAGERGDEVWTAIFLGLGAHLTDSGTAHLVLDAPDWRGGTFAERCAELLVDQKLESSFMVLEEYDVEAYRARYPEQDLSAVTAARFGIVNVSRTA